MTRPVIGVDVDGTVHNPWDRANAEAHRLSGRIDEPFIPWEKYDTLFVEFGYQVAAKAFAYACSPESIPERVIYPGCSTAIRQLQIDGWDIIFVTHNHDPDKMVEPLTKWLRQNFGSKVRVCVLRHDESKIDVLKAVKAFAMIDDKPSISEEAANEGLLSLMPQHLYNRDAEFNPGVVPFDPETEWDEVPHIINSYVENLIREKLVLGDN